MSIFNMPIPAAFGLNVRPADGAQLYFFEAGTTTPKTTYEELTETTPQSHPVVADASGNFPAIFLSGTYKVRLTDKNDVQKFEEDNLQERSGDVNFIGDFDSSTNGGDYPAAGSAGDQYKVTEAFTLNAASGNNVLQVGDFIQANKIGATGINADWDILRGVVSNLGVLALVDGANIATDLSRARVFTVTLGGDRTLDNPTNKIVGQTYTWEITQDGTGGRTLDFGTDFVFLGSKTVNPQANGISVVQGTVVSTTSIVCKVLDAPRITRAFWHTVNGYGSTNTTIQKFVTEIDSSDDIVVTVDNSATLGFTITSNTNCILHVSFSPLMDTSGGAGLSKNSSQLSTSIVSINSADRLGYATTGLNNWSESISWSGVLVKDDVVRPHTAGITDGSAASLGSIHVLAIEY